MRALAVALLLSATLSAGDQGPLAKAVKLFRSPDAGRREAGSQQADRELRKLLAPLLEALEDDDPEVRRRARRSILSLVPGEAEKDAKQQTAPQARLAIQRLQVALQAKALRQQAHFVRLQAVQLERIAEHTRAQKLLRAFGIETGPVPRLTVNGRPVASARRVLKVMPASRAARHGLHVGDMIVRIDGKRVRNDRELLEVLGAKPDWDRITVTVLRGDQLVRLPEKPEK
jgi:C-terminal processing protease CtpA/Prc